jgi:hypothetical protein
VIEQPVGRALNRDLVPDVTKIEKIEGELDHLISLRDKKRRQTEGDRAVEELWREGERRAAAKRREENHRSLLDNEQHLANVYYGRYLEKKKLIEELQSKRPTTRTGG